MVRKVKEAMNKFFMVTSSRRKERREKRKKETRRCGWTAKGISFILRDDSCGSLNLRLPVGGAALHFACRKKLSPSSMVILEL